MPSFYLEPLLLNNNLLELGGRSGKYYAIIFQDYFFILFYEILVDSEILILAKNFFLYLLYLHLLLFSFAIYFGYFYHLYAAILLQFASL